MLETIAKKAQTLVLMLSQRKMTITFAESCTGGLCAANITRISGASGVFKGSAVTYCDEVKNSLIGVSSRTLDTHTVYSNECALEMSAGVQKLFGADMAISLTGIAGPLGATEKDPVGTVYISLICQNTHISTRRIFTGDRDTVREKATLAAFEMAIDHLTNQSLDHKEF